MSSNFYGTLFSNAEDKRFYGLYRGIIVDSNDPLNKNRLKLKVPQVTGDAVTNWAWPCLTTVSSNKGIYSGVCGSFSDYTSQSTTVNTATAVKFNTTDISNGIRVVKDAAGGLTKVVFDKAGIYNIQWSGQFQNTGVALHDVSVWIKKGSGTGAAVDVPGSTGLISVPNTHGGVNGHTIVAWNYVLNLNANDYIQLYWSTDYAGVTIQYYAAATTPTRPSTASVLLTVDPISTPIATAGAGVWVMYEGGDPNFPVWMGVF